MLRCVMGLAAGQASGTEMDRPRLLGLLAEAYGSVGQTEAGLTTLTEALVTAHKTGEARVGGRVASAQGGVAAHALGGEAR